MKKTVAVAFAAAIVAVAAAPAFADSGYETCLKLGGGAACVKPAPFPLHQPAESPYEQMMEQLERDHDRQLWRRHIHEERERRAAGVLHENYLRTCATHSKRCRDELYGN